MIFLKRVNKWGKKLPVFTWFLILDILCLCFLIYSFSFRMQARDTGRNIGESSGFYAGRAIGSLEGWTKGAAEAYAAGTEAGSSAIDTEAEISNTIKEVGKLEVLVASGTYSDIISIGNAPDYAALLSQKYNAVFTVDLEKATINLQKDGLHIQLDQPVVEFIPDGFIEKKNEYQKERLISQPGSAEEGYIATDNSLREITEKAQQALQNNSSLQDAARVSAEIQLKQLVETVSLGKPEVFVEYRGGATNA